MSNKEALTIEHLMDLGPFLMNAYLVLARASKTAIIIDPGAEAEKILARLAALQVQPKAIYLTHTHIDHVLAIGPIREVFSKLPVYLPAGDIELYLHLQEQCAMFGLPPVAPEKDFKTFTENDFLEIAGHKATIWHTPGHTPGSCCFYFLEQQWLISGDVLFRESVGRTDLWGGDSRQLAASLRRLLTLPDATQVFPGHGPATSIGHERRDNPFVRHL